MGYKSAAEDAPKGIRRTMVENLFLRLEIIIEKHSSGGGVRWIVDGAQNFYHLYKMHHYECELQSIWSIT